MSSISLAVSTVKPAANFVPREDAKALERAINSIGKGGEEVITQILTRRSNDQRQQIIAAFSAEFGRDLTADLKSRLGGTFRKLILALMSPAPQYLANEVHGAMKGPGAKDSVLTAVLCTQSNESLHKMTEAYQLKHGKPVETALQGELLLSNDYKRLLTFILMNSRDEGVVDQFRATRKAERLYEAGEKILGTDEEQFINILSHASFEQIKLISSEYQRLYGKSLEKAIKHEFSGDLRGALLAILKFAESPFQYFSEILDGALRGVGTKDKVLIRVIVSRSEIDLEEIKREYQSLYKKSLYSAVQADTSGHYQTALLSIIGADH